MPTKMVPSQSGNTNAVQDQCGESENDQQAPNKACFLGQHGKDKIIVGDCFGQVTQLSLRAFEQALSVQPPSRGRNLGLIGIPTGAGPRGVDHLWCHKGQNSISLVIANGQQRVVRLNRLL